MRCRRERDRESDLERGVTGRPRGAYVKDAFPNLVKAPVARRFAPLEKRDELWRERITNKDRNQDSRSGSSGVRARGLPVEHLCPVQQPSAS